MIKFRSPAQLSAVGKILANLEYDGNTRIAQSHGGTIIISNRNGTDEIYTNGEVGHSS